MELGRVGQDETGPGLVGRDTAGSGGLTCRILQRSDRQSISSHGWYMPSVTQFSRITSMLMHSNHVHIESRTKQWGRGDPGHGEQSAPWNVIPAPPTINTGINSIPGSSPLWVPSLDGSMFKFSKALEPAYSPHNRHGHTRQTHQRTQTPPSHHLPRTHTHLPAPAREFPSGSGGQRSPET